MPTKKKNWRGNLVNEEREENMRKPFLRRETKSTRETRQEETVTLALGRN